MSDPYDVEATKSLCDSLGVVEVRARLLGQQFHVGQRQAVEGWLSRHESSVKVRDEERSEESLSISRKALSNSERATRIAISAIVLSIIMAIYEIIKWYSR